MTSLDGLDVSHYQGRIDWTAVPAYSFVAAKATDGAGFTDPTFATNWAAIRMLGFRHRVAYHFLQPGDGAAQARRFQSVVGQLQAGETLALDWEQPGTTADEAVAFLEALDVPGNHCPLVYVGEYFPGAHDPRIARWPLWLPGYSSTMHSSRPVTVWQFSSSGSVAGVTGRVDVNSVVNPVILELACGLVQPPAAPPSPDYALLRRRLAEGYAKSWRDLGAHDMNPSLTPQGLDVGLLQNSLNLIAGQGLAVNCVYDTATQQAVLNFQNWVNTLPGQVCAFPPEFPTAVRANTRFMIVACLDTIAAGKS